MAIFLKYGSLEGEASAKGYEKWIEIESISLGVGRGITAGVGGASKREATAPSVSEMTLTKSFDASSAHIIKESIGGKSAEVKIELTQTDNKGSHIAYQKYVLSDTLVSAYSFEGSSSGRPHERISLNFTKIQSEYIKIDDKFKTETTGKVIYDLSKAKSG